MTWRKLIPVSLGCAFLLFGAATAFAPSAASAAEIGQCADGNGNLCRKVCSLDDYLGCHEWDYYYYTE